MVTAQTSWSDPGRHRRLYEDLPDELGLLAQIIQGLAIYDVVAKPFYGFEVTDARGSEIHLRRVEDMLSRIQDLQEAPLETPRAPALRLVGRCHHYALLLVSMLRSKGVEARMRGGFATYFNPAFFEDHWVAEYLRDDGTWVFADAQLDAVWRGQLSFEGDPMNLDPSQFLPAAEAWVRCRSGDADPDRFGISFGGLHGLWFVGGSLIRDLAALNGVELLPWDVWGAQPTQEDTIRQDRLIFLDSLAALMITPDANREALSSLYHSDPRLRVGKEILNAITGQADRI